MVEAKPTVVLMVHPDDVNIADAKAEAARRDATIVANRFVPRGTILRCTQAALDFPPGPS